MLSLISAAKMETTANGMMNGWQASRRIAVVNSCLCTVIYLLVELLEFLQLFSLVFLQLLHFLLMLHGQLQTQQQPETLKYE